MIAGKPHRRQHWETVYETRKFDAVSWYEANPKSSLAAIERAGRSLGDGFIDIGGGASTLIDALVSSGWTDLTVLDISAAALAAAKARNGDSGRAVQWLHTDITVWRPTRTYALWHDRAVFHFLTDPYDRAAYKSALDEGLEKSGQLIMATFAADGPEVCSDLAVARYGPRQLASELGMGYELLEAWTEQHTTPSNVIQDFNWCWFRKV